jgi:hypothetical protein
MSIVVRCANFIVKLSNQPAVNAQRPTDATDRLTKASPWCGPPNPEIIECMSRAFADV